MGSPAARPFRFLRCWLIATPCPLLIAIPVAVIGSISLAAKRGIIVKDPPVLEQIDHCRSHHLRQDLHAGYGKPT